MRIHNNKKLFSSQDLRDFVECRFAVDLDLCDLIEPIERAKDSEWSQVLFRKGNEFEQSYLASLNRSAPPGTKITTIPGDAPIEERISLTHDAMSVGADFIYQAALSRIGVKGLRACEASREAPKSSDSRGRTMNLTLANPFLLKLWRRDKLA